MDKHSRVKRIEKELAKNQPEEGADQAQTDRFLKDLHKIYGEDDQPAGSMSPDRFREVFDKAMAKFGMKRTK